MQQFKLTVTCSNCDEAITLTRGDVAQGAKLWTDAHAAAHEHSHGAEAEQIALELDRKVNQIADSIANEAKQGDPCR